MYPKYFLSTIEPFIGNISEQYNARFVEFYFLKTIWHRLLWILIGSSCFQDTPVLVVYLFLYTTRTFFWFEGVIFVSSATYFISNSCPFSLDLSCMTADGDLFSILSEIIIICLYLQEILCIAYIITPNDLVGRFELKIIID